MARTFTVWVLALALVGPAALAQVSDVSQIKVPPLPTFHPPQPTRVVLRNGMVVFLQEDHELPLIDAVARIRGGSRVEPAEKVGLVSIYGQVWRTGGTTQRTGDQLDDFLEAHAAKVETGGGADSTTVSFSCLKEDFNDVFKIFQEVLRQPAFREDKIELAKNDLNTGIARRNDDINGIASREAAKLAYGKDNPYARTAEYSTVAAVTREDLVRWHQTYVHPNNIIFGIVGDFDAKQMEAQLHEAFDGWPKGQQAPDPQITFHEAKPGYYQVPKQDVNQSIVRMVELGTTRRNPDYYAITAFNEAFAGSFSSRLIKDIRTRQGLAYSVGGGIGTAFDHPGILQFALGTKSATTVQSVQSLYRELADVQTHPITADELKQAKDSILNSFVFNFDSPEKVLRERMAYEFYGYPADFLERYRAGIEKVTLQDVARVAQKYIHKEQLAVLVVGNTKEFDKPLSALGPVTTLDITIPGSPGTTKTEEAKAANPPASNAEGKALAAKVARAVGAEAKLQSIKSLRVAFQMTPAQGRPPAQIDTTIVFPDQMHAAIHSPQGTADIVVTPKMAFFSAPGAGVRDLPESQKNEQLDQIKRDLIYVVQHINDPAFTFTADGTAKVGDVATRIVDVNAAGARIRWYVDPQSGRILRESYPAVGPAGPVQSETDLLEWKTVDGLTMPYKHLVRQNGQPSSTVEYTSVQVNPQVDPKLFEKPGPTAGPSE